MQKFKKKILSLFTAISLVVSMVAVMPFSVSAAAEGNDYEYTITNGEATITSCSSDISGSIVIPSTLGGCPVTHIGDSAFLSCINLTQITIPDSVTYIGDSAFLNCKNLTSAAIPDGVTFIGDDTFQSCENLASVTIPDSVTYIGVHVFDGCKNLTSITIPDSVETIGSYAFYDCSSLTDVYYTGSAEDWKRISIDEFANDKLFEATIHFAKTDSSGSEKYAIKLPAEISVLVNGEKIEFDQAPILENGRTLVPMRGIFEALGAAVEWDENTQTITSNKNDTAITMQIGNSVMKKNGEEITLDAPPKIVNDRTLVPVRAVAEGFNSEVIWNRDTRTVLINDKTESGDAVLASVQDDSNAIDFRYAYVPIGMTDVDDVNNAGIRELTLVATNMTDRQIDSFSFACQLIDENGNIVTDAQGNTFFQGDVQNANLPGLVSTQGKVWKGSNWNYYRFNARDWKGADKVENITLTKIQYADGETVELQEVSNRGGESVAYDSIAANLVQIRGLIDNGMYLEAIQECDQTKAWHKLSSQDIQTLDDLKQEAQVNYDIYLYETKEASYEDISANVNQIRYFIDNGMYLEAIQECDQTKAWHTLSPEDIALLDSLKAEAQSAYDAYANPSKWEDLEVLTVQAVRTYIQNMKVPSSVQLYSVYSGYYERSRYNEDVSGEAFAVVADIAGQNSFGGITRDEVVIFMNPSTGDYILDLQDYGEDLEDRTFGLSAFNIQDEALNLRIYKTDVLSCFDPAVILEKAKAGM